MKKDTAPAAFDPSKTGAGPATGKDAEMPAQVGTNNGLGYNGEFSVGHITLRATGGGITLRNTKVGDNSNPKEVVQEGAVNNGLGFAGELKVGAITLLLGADGTLRLRHENVGTETEVATELVSKVLDDALFEDFKKGKEAETEVPEVEVEGVLEAAFFTRKIDADGTATTGEATK